MVKFCVDLKSKTQANKEAIYGIDCDGMERMRCVG